MEIEESEVKKESEVKQGDDLPEQVSNNVIPFRNNKSNENKDNKTETASLKTDAELKNSILEVAKSLINDYEKFTLLDYSNLKVAVDEYAKILVENKKYLDSYRVIHSKIHIDEGIKLRFLADMGKATEQDCSLQILDFIEIIETIQ
ncbi:hypothetical protein QEJ31_11240 [Pigmentibacter sp. JX0631]|uniref:hypothetical protein n=1 Tax=Pigmentibacter sp. JX0631 TaxID=2976982 RepID=UPI002468478A|nr:hypothetical protein [Pigmentibacter sp. JX0631]WGL59094.1 hypothetical protein QEJ31_11240 [Pigmentibacter sp. JX0631]